VEIAEDFSILAVHSAATQIHTKCENEHLTSQTFQRPPESDDLHSTASFQTQHHSSTAADCAIVTRPKNRKQAVPNVCVLRRCRVGEAAPTRTALDWQGRREGRARGADERSASMDFQTLQHRE
jgi:hypothetical protein